EVGVDSPAPVILADAHNTIVWLAPAPVVAKVATSPVGPAAKRLEREITVADHAASEGAPIARPSPLFEPRLYRSDSLAMTFWVHVEHDPAGKLDPQQAAGALGAVHDALLDVDGDLPDYTDRLREADAGFLPEVARALVPARDRELLELLSPVRGLCVSAGCWAQPGRHPDVTEAGQLHLRLLREAEGLG